MMAKRLNLSKDLETRLGKYMEFVWDQEERMNPKHEKMIMDKLSSSLRDEVYYETNVKYLRMIPVLNKILSEGSFLQLARKLEKIQLMPEEFVYKVAFLLTNFLF